MLTELCQELRNWFDLERYFGEFTIEGGQITVPDGSLQDGQYFRIIGSVFNDGVHVYGEELIDEVFKGAIWAMAVPPSVIALSKEIDDWNAKYADAVSSPYQSESFGGYSYSKRSGGSGSGNSADGINWQNNFASRLNKWRKI